MKTKSTLLLSALVLGASSLMATAQEGQGGRPPGGGPAGERGGRPLPPIMAALDANKDGEIDASELANATTALKALDKNADGKLTGDEIRPARGERGRNGGERGGQGGPGGGGRRGGGPDGGPRPGQ